MFRKIFILVILVMICTARPARAETACQIIDNVLGTVSLVREIQANLDKPGDQSYSENISKLDGLVDKISLPVLFPPKSRDVLSSESEAFFHYISNIRAAVAGAELGIDEYVKQTLSGVITNDFTKSIQSVEYYWSCRTLESDFLSESVGPAVNSNDSEAPSTTVKDVQIDPVETVLTKPNAQSLTAKNGVSKRANFVLPPIFVEGSLQVILLVFVTLIGFFFFAHKWSKNFKAREARRFLNKPFEVRIGKKYYAMIVLDISMNGFKLLHSEVIRQQRKVSIQLDGVWYAGHVKWSNEQYAGVKFVRPISNKTLNLVALSPTRAMSE